MDMLSRARAITVLSHPFFGALLLRMKMVPDPTIPTTMCNGEQIRYNPAFIEEQTVNKAVGLLCATTMHMVMLHHLRRGTREPRKWNLACDMAIEMILRSAGVDLPQKNAIPPKMLGLSAEHIYNELPDFPPDPSGQGQSQGQGQGQDDGQSKPNPDPGGNGGVEDSPGTKKQDQQQIMQEEADMNAATAQAAQQARTMGNLPKGISELIEKALRPIIHWPAVLRRFMTDRKPDDFTWSRGNRRYIGEGLYLPSMNTEPSGEIAIFVDTSGSVTSKELSQFLAEIQAISEDIRPTVLHVIGCDAAVQSVQRFEPGEQISVTIKGRGGTDFRPPFDYLTQHGINPKCIVYLTDGYPCAWPDEERIHCPVLWCINNDHAKPPFGEHVILA